MAASTRERAGQALDLTAKGLASFVASHLPDYTGARDVTSLLRIVTSDRAFGDSLSEVEAGFARELLDAATRLSDDSGAFSEPDTRRVLDTAVRLLRAAGAVSEAEEADDALTEFDRLTARTRSRRIDPASVVLPGTDGLGLKPWWQLITPHEDIRKGNFNASQFAANLYNVVNDKATREYLEPAEFFRRTYLTEGLKNLLEQAIRRISGDMNAAPVINLQTNFGGGKTHSMLALYHIFSGTPADEYPEEVRELADGVDLRELGSRVRRVVISGQDLPPQVGTDHDGTHVNTLWGEIAWQLGGRAAFERLAQADATGTNPGRAVLESIIAEHAPCLILIDEWVAYARQLYGKTGKAQLAAGTFDAHFSFAQAFMDAVGAVPGALLAVTIPASDNEAGGTNGQEALRRLQHLVRRVGEPWKQASSKESFEIVRRRLFEDVTPVGEAEIRAIARRFGAFYGDHRGEFPAEAALKEYEDDIRAAYPIHPELFQRLYDDWSTLERFQRTRGVLTLLSAVIQVLWEAKDHSPMIMPATLPLNAPGVGDKLVQYLDDRWQPIIDRDVEGRDSTPARIDNDRPLYGQRSVTERLARTIFIGSAATLRSANKGIEKKRVWLGTAVPGDATGNFDSALHLLAERATYLYTEGDRYWYDVSQSVTKTVRDIADSLIGEPERVYQEIAARLQLAVDRSRNGFTGVDCCPTRSDAIPDDDRVRLVIVHPENTHKRDDASSAAMDFARDAIRNKGNVARKHPNMLVFLAADGEKSGELMSAARDFYAWRYVHQHVAEMGLTGFQERLADDRYKRATGLFDQMLSEAYCWTLVPSQPDGNKPAVLTAIWTASPSQGLVERVSDRLIRDGMLADRQAPANIRLVLRTRLAGVWEAKGSISVGELWGLYTRYTFMPRLRDRAVLVNGIRAVLDLDGWESNGFALAIGVDGDHFEGLAIPGTGVWFGEITDATLLVVPERALAQHRRQQTTVSTEQALAGRPAEVASSMGEEVTQGALGERALTLHFYGLLKISKERYGKAFKDLQLEILPHLDDAETELEITVEIHARRGDGFSEEKQRIVTENAKVLKFEDARFES
jgi:predicted AAA+ superfamily ATPase